MAQRVKPNPGAFDPFQFAPLFRWARHLHTRWVMIVGVVAAGVLVAATKVEGTFGSQGDFQPEEDVQRVFGVRSIPPSTNDFSLMRDVTTWFLVLMMVTTCMLVHRQWRLMAAAIPTLVSSRVLRPKQSADLTSTRARILFLPRVMKRRGTGSALEILVQRVNEFGRRFVARSTVLVAGLSALLAYSLLQGEKGHGLFGVLMPSGLDPAARTNWLNGAYQNWWASDAHPLGNFAYFIVAIFACYVILMQNVVGVTCAYLATALPAVAELDADWLNRDGRYGWTPVAKIFRTVYGSLALHGFTLSLILVILGIENFPWIGGLVLIWIVVVPLYLAVPWLVFRRVEQRARERRTQMLAGIADRLELDTDRDVDKLQGIVAEIERVRRARIRPMGLRLPELSTFAVVVILPIALTTAQIFFSLRFGLT